MWKIIYRADGGLGGVRGQREKKRKVEENTQKALYAHINISKKNFNKKDKNSNYVLSIKNHIQLALMCFS